MSNVILRVKREDGSWAEIPALVGPEGPQGVSINDIVLKSQEGGVSTYSIILSDGSEKTFQVTDGAIITDVSLINTNVLIDTYRISISDGSYFEFRVTNGRGIKSIAKTSTDVLSDTYTISYNDNTTSTYTITNGRGIDYIEKDQTIGLSDRYTIHYNDGTTSYYHVVNGEVGPSNVLSIGSVTKGDEASASITGNSPKQVLNLVLPKGDKGDTGPQGPQGIQGPPGETGADKDLSNLTEEGLKVIKDNSGGGLEVCDIGTALYVDETKGLRRYLNGQIVDINTNTQAFLNRLLEIKNTNPDYFTTEDNWQSEALLNIDGCVYKFVLNYSGETVVSVRLPKYPDYVEINAGGTLPVVGNGLCLGLTDGTSNGALVQWGGTTAMTNAKDALYGQNVGTTTNTSVPFATYAGIGVVSDPTKSGIQTTLKQTKLKMRYFIQIATGSETENNIINDIELNNPYSLFDSKYSDHELNNLSWLKSEGQWNAKSVYPTAYDKLLKVYNGTETVEGLSVKLSTETYTDYDFVLNTANETFRLPIKTKLASGKAVVGNGLTLGLTNGTQSFGLGNPHIASYDSLQPSSSDIGKTVGSSTSGSIGANNKLYGVTTDPTKSGIELSDSGLYLYFYVGETVQNANLIDAGRIGEQLANKQDKCIHIIDTYVNGTSGYRVWSDGYCEQWGIATITSNSGVYLSVTFIKKFRDINYNLIKSNDSGNSVDLSTSTQTIGYTATTSKSTDGFRCFQTSAYTGLANANWRACGYLAEGEY